MLAALYRYGTAARTSYRYKYSHCARFISAVAILPFMKNTTRIANIRTISFRYASSCVRPVCPYARSTCCTGYKRTVSAAAGVPPGYARVTALDYRRP